MTAQVRRSPRRPGPAMPRGELVLESPPELVEVASGGLGQYLFYLPMLAGAGAMAFLYSGPGASAVTYAASAMYGLSSLGMLLGQFSRGAGDRGRRVAGDRRDYLRYLGQARQRVRAAAGRQRVAQFWSHPDPENLWSYAMGERRFERSPDDADFGQVRIATGAQQSALRLIPPETRPVADLDPICAGALRRFVAAHRTVADLPVAVALRNYARIALTGDPALTRAQARAIIAQTVTFHAPQDLRVAVCAGAAQHQEWDWVKWLPHALHPTRTDGAGRVRLIRDDLGEIEALLGEDLAERPRFTPGVPPQRAQLLVILDGGRVPLGCQLAVGDAAGVTVLDVGGLLGRDVEAHQLRLRVDPAGSAAAGPQIIRISRDDTGSEVRTVIGTADQLGTEQASALGHVLAPAGGPATTSARSALAERYDLPALLGVADLGALDPATSWQRRATRDRMRVPIGVAQDGARLDLDLKEAAQGGMGPHGLVLGATGSGKSELLRTLVVGLVATHSPEALNLVLADFKGGATFLGLEDLPHVSAVITNLARELPLVDRMQDALRGELVRRQELLRAAGNLSSIVDYDRLRTQRPELSALPTLLVIVDEFSELLASKPDFAELFVMIGRLGRSLGVHLLLASQRLDEGRLRGLETHLSYRICLRTFSANESRVALGVPDAHWLPREPGHAYLRHEVASMTRFKAAYVSGRHERRGPAVPVPFTAHPRVLPFSSAEVAMQEPSAQAVPADRDDGPRVLDIVVERLRGHGIPAHRVWLPPLDSPSTLGQLLPDLHLDAERGLCADAAWHSRLQVPLGEVDLPAEQRRAVLIADLSGAAGHVAVVGAPQSGKTTLLRSLVAGLALTHTRHEVTVYAVDFGGGGLAGLGDLPHVGAVAGRSAPDLVRAVVMQLAGLLRERERGFAVRGIDSVAAFRRASADGDAGDSYGDVFLVVDGWGTVRAEFEVLEPVVAALAVRGLAFGIHLVLATNRWADLRPQLRDSIGSRFELRLGDPFESEVNRRAAANVPAGAPGRGLRADGAHFLSALPRIDGQRAVEDASVGLARLVEAVRVTWPGTKAPPVRLLPDRVHLHEVASRSGPGLAIGLLGDGLDPALLDFADDPHLLIFGDAGSGKSTLLRTIAAGVVAAYHPEQARIIVVDPRRTMHGVVPPEHLLRSVPSAATALETVRDVRDAMLQRLPDATVTPAQLRDRSWWQGPELYLLVDDYELLGDAGGNPLTAIVELLAHGRDIGLHVVLARASGGAARAMFEPAMQRLKELGTGGIVLSGSPDEGPLVGTVRPRPLPAGRGTLYHRRHGERLVQIALPDDDRITDPA